MNQLRLPFCLFAPTHPPPELAGWPSLTPGPPLPEPFAGPTGRLLGCTRLQACGGLGGIEGGGLGVVISSLVVAVGLRVLHVGLCVVAGAVALVGRTPHIDSRMGP